MRSFTFRITCRFALLVTATTAVLLVVAGILLDRQIAGGLEFLHDVELGELSALLGPPKTLTAAEVSQRIKQHSESDAALFVMQVSDRNGNVLFRSENLGDSILGTHSRETRETTKVRYIGRVHVSTYIKGPWCIQVGSPLEPSERLLRDYTRLCVPLLIGVGLVSVGLGYAFARATLRPLRAIEATANRIRADNLTERIPVPAGRDELAALTQLLNQMFDRLQISFEEVRRFAADASHELKTPLALIQLNAEKLRPRVGHDPEANAALGDVLEEINRLNGIIDRLLFLAKAESGAIPVTLQPVSMTEFVAKFAEDAVVLAEDRGVRFVVGKNEDGVIKAEPDLLRQLLLNLASNAVAASSTGGVVQLDSCVSPEGWQLTMTDEGPGIPPEDLPNLFNRFFRIRSSYDGRGAQPGHGLGLAISRSIAELHGGSIRAENRLDRRGLSVTLVLPR